MYIVNTVLTVTQPQMQKQESHGYQDMMSANNKWNVTFLVSV